MIGLFSVLINLLVSAFAISNAKKELKKFIKIKYFKFLWIEKNLNNLKSKSCCEIKFFKQNLIKLNLYNTPYLEKEKYEILSKLNIEFTS